MAASDDETYTEIDNVEEDDGYIKVAGREDASFMEFPKEDDDTIMFSTIEAQFPNATGLKFKGPSGAWRAIRAVDNVLAAPKGGWGNRTYIVTVLAESTSKQKSDAESTSKKRSDVDTRKRKADTDTDSTPKFQSKHSKPSVDGLLKDLPVTGLPYTTTSEELKDYFEKNYGELELCEVKKDRVTNKSRGFAFIRFKNANDARNACDNLHQIGDRTVTVKIKHEKPMKLFVGRLPKECTSEDLDDYFSKFGQITDIQIPLPFRNFAFVEFASTEDGRRVLNRKHALNDSNLNIEENKADQQNDRNRRSSDNRGFGDRRQSSSREQSSRGGRFNNSNPRDFQQPQPGNSLQNDLRTLLFHYLSGN